MKLVGQFRMRKSIVIALNNNISHKYILDYRVTITPLWFAKLVTLPNVGHIERARIQGEPDFNRYAVYLGWPN